MAEHEKQNNDWQTPFLKAFEDMPEFKLPEGDNSPEDNSLYQWKKIDPESRNELQNLIYAYGNNTPDEVQDMLAVKKSQTEIMLLILVTEVVMHRIHNRYGSIKVVFYSPFGSSSRAPISVVSGEGCLVFYKHPTVNPEVYKKYLEQLIVESNYILEDLEREKLPKYPY